MEEIKGPKRDVDYNKIIPMPMTIPNYTVGESFLMECLAAFCTIQEVPWPRVDMIQETTKYYFSGGEPFNGYIY